MTQSPNVLRFRRISPSKEPQFNGSSAKDRSWPALLAAYETASKQRTKEGLRETLLLLEMANEGSRAMIDRLSSESAKCRLLADLAVVDDLIRIARDHISHL